MQSPDQAIFNVHTNESMRLCFIKAVLTVIRVPKMMRTSILGMNRYFIFIFKKKQFENVP